MTSVTKFDIPKFDRKMSLNIWKIQMMIVLTQNGSKMNRSSTMIDEQLEQLDEKALSTIQLCLATHVLSEVLDATTTADL